MFFKFFTLQFSILKRFIRYVFLGICTLLCVINAPALADIQQLAPTWRPVGVDLINSAQEPVLTPKNAQQLDNEGRSFYEAGQFNEAVDRFEQAIEGYQIQGDWLRQALSLGNLALTYQQLGQWQQAYESIAESMQLLESESFDEHHQTQDEANRLEALAQVLDIQGSLQLVQGQPEAAITSWKRSLALYRQLEQSKPIEERITENQINQAQALKNLGLYRRSIDLLYVASGLEHAMTRGNGQSILQNLPPEELRARLQTLPSSATTAIILQSLGDALHITGNLDQAEVVLQHAFQLAKQLDRTSR